MIRNNLITAGITIGILSCAQPNTPSPDHSATGTAEIRVVLNPVGALAKRADIDLSTLNLELYAPGEDTLRDTIAVSGNSSQTISKDYDNLAALVKQWVLKVEGRDTRDSLIYYGTETFVVPADSTIDISIQLEPMFSMLDASFFPIQDSVTRCELHVDGTPVASESCSIQSLVGDTVSVSWDYLPASPGGTQHTIGLRAYGKMWGLDTLLYAKDTAITVVSGQLQSLQLFLDWVGPSAPPPGAASMSVSLGAVGTVSIQAHLAPASAAALQGVWSRAELRDDSGSAYFGEYSIEAYGFSISPARLTEWDIVCPDSTCSDTTVVESRISYDIVYGESVASSEADLAFAVDITDSSAGVTYYTIATVDTSTVPSRMTFGDSGEDPAAGTSPQDRILSIGTSPEYFFWQ